MLKSNYFWSGDNADLLYKSALCALIYNLTKGPVPREDIRLCAMLSRFATSVCRSI